MSWNWRCETREGTQVRPERLPESFPSQGDAETWLGETWRDLLGAGVDQVTLVEDGREVYGPMSLHPAE